MCVCVCSKLTTDFRYTRFNNKVVQLRYCMFEAVYAFVLRWYEEGLYTIPPPCLLSRAFRKTFRCINVAHQAPPSSPYIETNLP